MACILGTWLITCAAVGRLTDWPWLICLLIDDTCFKNVRTALGPEAGAIFNHLRRQGTLCLTTVEGDV
jgi:hypothetical protein